RSACKRALRAQLIRLGQNVQAERAERAGSLVDKYGVSTSNTQIFGPIFAVVYVQAGTDTAVEEPVL
ncbi:hypothetical protein PtrCC142_011859, partial [Pyrenophora tritici-repentis]